MTITKQEAWTNFTKGIKTIQRYACMAVEEYNTQVHEDYRFPLGRTQKPKWMCWSSSHGEEEYKNDEGDGKPTKADILEHYTGCIFISLASAGKAGKTFSRGRGVSRWRTGGGGSPPGDSGLTTRKR